MIPDRECDFTSTLGSEPVRFYIAERKAIYRSEVWSVSISGVDWSSNTALRLHPMQYYGFLRHQDEFIPESGVYCSHWRAFITWLYHNKDEQKLLHKIMTQFEYSQAYIQRRLLERI